tara:strand:- start:216 stop:749 length:534 start_codon:yes stop_codon:yes gene_type:complete
MNLYYTGAANLDEAQQNPTLSLGNYISSTQVPNDFLGATFEEISKLKITRGSKQVFMLALKNTTGSTATDVTIYYDYPTSNKYSLQLAFVSPSNDLFEKIPSNQSSPLSATFVEYSGVGNAVNIGDIANNAYIGVWFRAELVASNVDQLTCDELYDNYVAETVTPTEESLSFVISYT